ncbi:MAG: RDD family protein [Bacteroidia bacterium]|nr:RDD family protein [Bacteroidia bacterium]
MILDEPIDIPEEKKFVLADNWKRFINLCVDNIFVSFMLIVILVALILAGSVQENFLDSFMINIYLILGQVIFYTLMEFLLNGRTFGKYITGTKMLSTNGNKATFSQVFGRSWARIIPFEAFSFFGKPGKGWHDSMSGTMVIDIKKSRL